MLFLDAKKKNHHVYCKSCWRSLAWALTLELSSLLQMSLILPSPVLSQPQLTGPNSGKCPGDVAERPAAHLPLLTALKKPQNVHLAVPKEARPTAKGVARSL